MWCSQKEALTAFKKSGKSKTKRFTEAGQKALFKEMEEAFFSWILDLCSQTLLVSCSMIQL